MPISKSQPITDLSRKTILLWGPPKIGKSELASQFPDAVVIATERGLDDLAATRWETTDGRYVVKDWEELTAATGEVVTSGAKLVVLDTADNAYFMCEQFICAKHGVEYKLDGTLGYGKGTVIINNEFRRYLLKIAASGVGFILTSHATIEEKEERKIAVPTLPDKIRPIITGMVDMILYFKTETVQIGNNPVVRRFIYTKPSPLFIAGDRTGRLPESIMMPDDHTQNFATFFAAYQGTPTATTAKGK